MNGRPALPIVRKARTSDTGFAKEISVEDQHKKLVHALMSPTAKEVRTGFFFLFGVIKILNGIWICQKNILTGARAALRRFSIKENYKMKRNNFEIINVG